MALTQYLSYMWDVHVEVGIGMSSSPIHILVVDDEPDLCALSKDFLEQSKAMEVDTVCSVREAMAELTKKRYDAIVSDYQMPGEDGIQFLKSLRAAGDRTPFIQFTGKGREEVVIEALNSGADSYMQKGGRAVPQYAELEHRIRVLVQRHRAEEALRGSEEKYRLLFDAVPVGIALSDLEGTTQAANRSMQEITGYTLEDLKTITLTDTYVDPDEYQQMVQVLSESGHVRDFEAGLKRKDGTIYRALLNVNQIEMEGRRAFLTAVQDITDRKRAELELVSAQEAIKEAHHLAHIGTWDWVIENDTVTWSEELYDILGYDPLLPAPSCAELPRHYTPASWESLSSAVSRALTTGEPYDLELEIVRPDGSIRWTNAIGSVKRDGKGKVIGLHGIVQDITERKRVEEALRQSEEKFRVISESSPDRILVQDSDLRYVWVLNPQLGLTPPDIIGKTDHDILSKEDADKITSVKREVMKSGKQMRFSTSLPSLDGSKEYFEGVYIPRHDPKGRNDGIIGYFRNVTETLRAQEALREANRKLNLLSSITRHDIKNQLMALSGNLTLLEKKQFEHSPDRHLLKAEAAAERISAVIQFTKEYEDIGVYAPIWQDVQALVRTASGGVPLEKMRLVNNVPAGIEVFADPLIAKVFHNLMDNAMRHGGNITTIRFSVEEHDGARAIVCEDDGIGISADMKEKLFTRGFGKHHGFGLFLSREILSITGMTITEEGEPGRGARFVMTVPAGGLRGPKTNGS
jgi:PAS domain S-box-containing protein